MRNFSMNSSKYDFTSDNINIIVLVYDYSGSMRGDINAIQKANQAFRQDFSKFEDKGSIAISKARFANSFAMSSFLTVDEFDTSYSADGGTELYYAIRCATDNTLAYYKEIVKRLNVRPRITFMVFTDGWDTSESRTKYDKAKEAIKELNNLDATTVLVAFREAINSGIGKDLGFTCTKDIKSVDELILCLGKQLSKSCKEQSKSVYALKSEFFSQAEKNSSEDDVEENPITDYDFFNI